LRSPRRGRPPATCSSATTLLGGFALAVCAAARKRRLPILTATHWSNPPAPASGYVTCALREPERAKPTQRPVGRCCFTNQRARETATSARRVVLLRSSRRAKRKRWLVAARATKWKYDYRAESARSSIKTAATYSLVDDVGEGRAKVASAFANWVCLSCRGAQGLPPIRSMRVSRDTPSLKTASPSRFVSIGSGRWRSTSSIRSWG
jgi:hypothetical protein